MILKTYEAIKKDLRMLMPTLQRAEANQIYHIRT